MSAHGFVLPPLAHAASPDDLRAWVRDAAKGARCTYASGTVTPRAHPGFRLAGEFEAQGLVALTSRALDEHKREWLMERTGKAFAPAPAAALRPAR